jgi:signal transduction histidine kinase
VRVSEPDLATAVGVLIDNALAYGSSADGAVRLRIQGVVEGEILQVHVADSGSGIDPDFAPRVFEPFYRGPGAEYQVPGGSGVGLAVARRAIERWGGRIRLTSTGPEGTVFSLQLPVSAKRSVPAPA